MRKAQQLHNSAMSFADKALLAKLEKNNALSLRLFRQAFQKEAEAAQLTRNQPSRAILFRSAANLAIEADDAAAAEQMACLGLASAPPSDIADELRHVLDRATFKRHLHLDGIKLSPASVQLSVAGPSVGYGDAPESEIMSRVDTYRKLVIRSANRKRGIAYSDNISPTAIPEDYRLFMSTPLAKSFAVILRVGSREMQHHLDYSISADEVIDDVLENLEHFEADGEAQLKESIPDADYRRNFVALARRLAPDGSRITTVGLTRATGKEERIVAMRRPRSGHIVSRAKKAKSPTITLEGTLEAADRRGKSQRGQIILINNAGEYRIKVPKGMLSDIVRPNFGAFVKLLARQKAAHVFEFLDFLD